MKTETILSMLALGTGAVALLSGCIELNPNNLSANGSASQSPTFNQNETERTAFSQNEAVAIPAISPFQLKIEKAYWTKTLNMGPVFNGFKPEAEFLVIDFTLTNLGTQGVQWQRDNPPSFVLVNSQGSEYVSVTSMPAPDDINQKLFCSGGINPGMSIKGRKIFDVPKSDYVLKVCNSIHTGNGHYVSGPTIFTWNLKPSQR